MRKLFYFSILSLFMVSCQSERDKLIEERDEAVEELNDLKRSQERQGVRFEYEVQDHLSEQQPLIDKIHRLNEQIISMKE